MKKVKLYILQFLYILCATIEFTWSVLVALVDTIGSKLTELTDTIEKLKAKS